MFIKLVRELSYRGHRNVKSLPVNKPLRECRYLNQSFVNYSLCYKKNIIFNAQIGQSITMLHNSIFFVMLENSKIEQIPVNIYLTNHLIVGIVTNVDDHTAELRLKDNKRCTVALDKIEAIAID
jgi:hypothetical protein